VIKYNSCWTSVLSGSIKPGTILTDPNNGTPGVPKYTISWRRQAAILHVCLVEDWSVTPFGHKHDPQVRPSSTGQANRIIREIDKQWPGWPA
jgi:hypothetical protein